MVLSVIIALLALNVLGLIFRRKVWSKLLILSQVVLMFGFVSVVLMNYNQYQMEAKRKYHGNESKPGENLAKSYDKFKNHSDSTQTNPSSDGSNSVKY